MIKNSDTKKDKMSPKGDIWISAVLYMALGIIVIALILAASLPLIDRLKDRNTMTETKKLLVTTDETIKIVAREGPGSQRELSPLTVNKGQLFIDEKNDTIAWKMKTSAPLLEPNIVIKEGVLSLLLAPTPVKDEYLITMGLSYHNDINLTLVSDYKSPFMGKYTVVITHTGTYTTLPTGETMPIIAIRIN